MKFIDDNKVLPEIKERSRKQIAAVNAWVEAMKGTMVCVKTISTGQPQPYADHVYESVIYCFQPNGKTTGAPLPRVIDEAQAKAIARIFVHTFDDEPKDWASPRLEFIRPEPDPCLESFKGHAEQGLHSCWRVRIGMAYTG